MSSCEKSRKMGRAVLVGAAVAALLGTMAFSPCGSGEPLEVRIKRVVVFKDGYGMFIKQAVGKADGAGCAVVKGIPAAMVLGSFWVLPEEGKLIGTVAKKVIIPRKGRQEAEKELLLQFDKKSANRRVSVELVHFGPGIRWIPTYRVTLHKDGEAEMAMQAEILNEAEDLNAVPLDLVVGVPNFRFKNVVSPMSLEPTLTNALLQAAPQIMRHDSANVMFSQRMAEVRGRAAAPRTGHVPAIPAELAGEGVQDLFVHPVRELSLRAGERAALPLFRARVPLRHLYAWDVNLSRAGTESLPTGSGRVSPVKLLKNEVWHLIEMTNKTSVPWTTGAALIVDGYLPIAQELLTYTAIGGKCQVPLTVAVDVRGTYREEETGRKLKAVRFNGNDHTRISKRGTLKVTNYKREPITLEISCQLGGNAAEVSDGGDIVITGFQRADWSNNFRGHPALTGHSTITWELVLKAGETKEVTCDYFYYVR